MSRYVVHMPSMTSFCRSRVDSDLFPCPPQVTEPSIFRLTTHAPTVPARPMLVPGGGAQEPAFVIR